MHAIAGFRPRAGGVSWNRARRGVQRFLARIADWQERERERHSFARLDDRLLADIGLSREQQSRECTMTFWGIVTPSNPHDTKLYRSFPNLRHR